MKRKIALAILTASFYVAFPVFAQNPAGRDGHGDGHGRGHGNHGNNSNHSGHDDDGNSAGHRQDRPHGFGDDDDNLILANPAMSANVASAVTSVTADLKSASLTSSGGTAIPAAAQNNTYALLSGDPTFSASRSAISTALSTAGPEASAIVPSFVESFAALRTDPSRLPTVIAAYNKFTKAASSSFISSPPPEFIAVHAVLARLVAATSVQK